jgi:hypothetical protein
MDSFDNQSFILRSELADSQNHPPVVSNSDHARGNDSLKSADKVSEFAQHHGGTYPLTASLGRVHNELTGGDAAKIDDDI